MTGETRFCRQFLSTGVLKIALVNQVAVKLRQRRQGEAQFFAPLTLLQQRFHVGFRVWRKSGTMLILMPTPPRCSPSTATSIRCNPLAGFIPSFQIISLTPAQKAAAVPSDVFWPARYTSTARA